MHRVEPASLHLFRFRSFIASFSVSCVCSVGVFECVSVRRYAFADQSRSRPLPPTRAGGTCTSMAATEDAREETTQTEREQRDSSIGMYFLIVRFKCDERIVATCLTAGALMSSQFY